ncbi:MAG TPA: aminotransferase class I/II-fold pyridoxal phosphate-dependent enzyme [Kofleriaceae bacterium]|nr:aminotransferase class I/II-fold pyridoxal phosphate-dependent enzyme [Kofleriaceae bacterium]
MRIETLAVHAGGEPDGATGAIAPPIHLSTTFEHPPDSSQLAGFIYSRYGNPSQDRLESALAALEGGAAAVAYASGMAAAVALFHALPRGSHVLLGDDIYFSVRTVAREHFPRWGLEASIVDATDLAAMRAAMRRETRCIWIESPSNPRLKVADIAAIAELARGAGALLVVDSTFAPPVVQRPLELGAHVVMQSCTKYLAGHADAQAGALVLAEAGALLGELAAQRTVLGPVVSPFTAWMVLRGLRTLPCRMEWHARGAAAVADFLARHPRVERVHYPGLASHPQHQLARRQMRSFGGMLSFELAGGAGPALACAGRLRLFRNATSLGSTESLVEHRASLEGPDSPTPPGLLRLSIGLEHPDDLVADLAQALDGV